MPVTLNSFQGPWSEVENQRQGGLAAAGAPWMLKQVQHDEVGEGAFA
jgi:hypothetical protein